MSVGAGEVPGMNNTAAPSSRLGDSRIPTESGRTVPGGGARPSELFQFPGRYRERRDGDLYAGLRAEEMACRAYSVSIEGSARQVMAGGIFRAANPFDFADKAMAPPPDQRFLAVGVEFEVMGDVGDAIDRDGEPAQFYRAVVEAIPAETQFRPQRRTPRPRIGAQTALVVGRPGETITVDHLGRIKLHFFWDREGKRDENSSCWVRVAQSWAGKGFGGLVIPRTGQEVVVEFLHADPDRPIVVGAVYNGTNLPPEILPEHATRSTFHTCSDGASPGTSYNELRFDDRAGSESVHLRAQRHHTLDVKSHYVLSAGAGAAISTPGAAVIESGHLPASPIGSRIEVTQDGIALRVTGLGGEQSILIDAEGITINGRGIRLLSTGELLVNPVPLPLPPPLLPVTLAAMRQEALLAAARRLADAVAAPIDE